MPVGDSGARPKDYKLEPPKDVGAALVELEKQEKTLEKELKKLTPKKVLDDIDLLKAERDELKRQVMQKRQSSEKDKFVAKLRNYASNCHPIINLHLPRSHQELLVGLQSHQPRSHQEILVGSQSRTCAKWTV